MAVTKKIEADFCIAIDFQKDTETPSRIFRSLSDLIDSFHALDLDLLQSLDVKIEPIVLLEDIEAGSIKTWLKYILTEIEDEALKKLDWKPAVGKYLVKAKYFIIHFLEGKTEITDRKEIENLNKELLQLAHETDIKHIPSYAPLPPQKLLQHIEGLVFATSHLAEKDAVKYITSDNEASFNLKFNIVPEAVEDILTKETIESNIEMILKIKKPDYLGESQWEVKHANKTIPVKILDTEWLTDFQNRKIDIRPGDSIRASVHMITKYDYDLNVIATKHNITKILKVIPLTLPDQGRLIE